jgi:hypothetical protein
MSIVNFSSVPDFNAVLAISSKTMGASGTVYFDARPGQSNLFQGPVDMKQSFYVRPAGMAKEIKKGTRFEINLQVNKSAPDTAAFVDACARLDKMVLASVYARKAELLPSKAPFIDSMDALKPLYVSGRLLKNGSTASDGSKYEDTIRLKVVGDWGEFVDKVNTRTVVMRGTSTAMVDSCDWRPRQTPLGEQETRFFLYKKTTPEGKDVYTDKVAIPGLTGPDGKPQYRAVGPQDCTPGALITPLFSMSNVYFTEGFGVTATARALYVKPRVEAKAGGGGGAGGSAVPMLPGATLEHDDDME